ncbi:MAG: ACP S-malonyltransferase [Fimbriimonadaceae bacterium]|nr:ACP S-malonyltransferase [Fimbriimonadaceae bacterium]
MFAVVFPGQGSQKPGMGKELFDAYDAAKAVFQTVSDAAHVDAARLCFETDEETLRQTQNAQMALYTVGVAAYSCLQERLGETQPGAFAGHSVGEYAALTAAGFLSIEDGARLVLRRGDLMARSGKLRPGTMAAVLGLEKKALHDICKASSQPNSVVVIANDNCPGQLVISGDVDAVQRASAMASEQGAKRVLPINVSGAFHSPLMEEASMAMLEALKLASFNGFLGQIPVFSNVTSEPSDLASSWPVLLETQLKSPVRWTETIQNMMKEEVDTFVECGSGEVLCGLIKRTSKEVRTLNVGDPASLDATVEALNGVKS